MNIIHHSQRKTNKTHRHKQCGGYQREGGGVKGVIYMVIEYDLTLGGAHTMQCADHVS